MYSKIDIINLALANISNLNGVQGFGENNVEAQQADKHWGAILTCVLAEAPWSFATRMRPLALLEADAGPAPWSHHYVYPDDCVRLRRVYSPDVPMEGAQFRLGRSTDNRFRVVMAGAPPLVAEYTTREISVAEFPPHFANALAWRLAAEIALAMRADAGLADGATRAYMLQLEAAKLHNADEAGPRPRRNGSWLEARHG